MVSGVLLRQAILKPCLTVPPARWGKCHPWVGCPRLARQGGTTLRHTSVKWSFSSFPQTSLQTSFMTSPWLVRHRNGPRDLLEPGIFVFKPNGHELCLVYRPRAQPASPLCLQESKPLSWLMGSKAGSVWVGHTEWWLCSSLPSLQGSVLAALGDGGHGAACWCCASRASKFLLGRSTGLPANGPSPIQPACPARPRIQGPGSCDQFAPDVGCV